MTMFSYEMVLQVLPIIINTKNIDIEQYANYFIDEPNAINFGINMKEGIGEKNLPKFAYKEFELKEIKTEGRISELDLVTFATKYIIELDDEDKEIHKEEEELEVERAEHKAAGRKGRLHGGHTDHHE